MLLGVLARGRVSAIDVCFAGSSHNVPCYYYYSSVLVQHRLMFVTL